MQIKVVDRGGPDFTDLPRALTDAEMRRVGRLDAIKLHRALT